MTTSGSEKKIVFKPKVAIGKKDKTKIEVVIVENIKFENLTNTKCKTWW